MTPLAGATRMPTPGLFTMLLLLITSFAGPARTSLMAWELPALPPTRAFSMYTLAAAWIAIGLKVLFSALIPIFRRMTVFPGALMTTRWVLLAPPAKQSIVTEMVMVTL